MNIFIVWICFALLVFAISILILRWAFRINDIVKGLERIASLLENQEGNAPR
jgi:hypothetical protein